MKQRILIKIDELEQVTSELVDTLPKSYQEYSNSPVVRRAVERLIQICIECIMDICSILNKKMRLGVPKTSNDIFEHLENTVFSESMVEKLRGMKSFRNRIVHRYGEIDDKMVYDIVQQSIGHFREFGLELRKFLTTYDS